MAKPKIKNTITKKEWNKKHKDFKLMGKDGIPYIMAYDDKIGTHLVPVKIIEATDAEEKEFHTKLDTLVHNTFGKSPEEMEESVGAELDLIKQSSKDVKDFLKNVFKDSDFRAMKSDKDFIKYLKSIYEGVSVNESIFSFKTDNIEQLHFETNPKKAELMKIELGKMQGEINKRKQIESGEYSLRLFRKKIKYGNGKDVGVFLPGSYDAATSKLGDGPHKKAVKKVNWNQKKYDQWLEDMASNGGAKNAFDMAQNAKNEPGLIDWVKKNFRGDKPLQRIQWDIEGFNESVVNEAKDNLYLQLHKKYAEQIKGLKAKKIKKLTDLVSVQRWSMEEREDYFGMDSKKKKELSKEYDTERKLFKKYIGGDESVMLPKGTETLSEESVNEGKKKLPKFKNIPSWARYVAQHSDGEWTWYEETPTMIKFRDGSGGAWKQDGNQTYTGVKTDGKDWDKMPTYYNVKNGKITESINEVKEPEVITQLRKIVKDKQNALVVDTKSKKKVRVDMQSASLMVQVYDALKQQSNKDKFVKSGIVAMGHMAYKLMKNESVNEAKAFVVMFKDKKDLPNRNVKPSSAAYSKEVDAKKFLKSVEKDGGKGMIVKSNVSGMKVEAKDTEVYHKSYTHAIEAAQAYALKKGYTIEDDEMFTKVGMNSKRPSVGKTTKVNLELLRKGKPQKKMLHIQVYGMKNGYELNAYIN
jgi:hypothetical protein